MVIVKRRDSSADPWVWHTSLTGAAYFLKFDSTAAQTNTNTPWGTGGWTSSTFMVTNNGTENTNASGGTYVAYLFASTTGFSSFGTYTGNGAADGPFIYTGFKPKYVMVKRTDTSGYDFQILDTARDTYNVAGNLLQANSNSSEGTGNSTLDFLMNGIKVRTTAASINASGGTYIYAAFAEQPFKYSASPAASSNSFVQAVAFLIGMVF